MSFQLIDDGFVLPDGCCRIDELIARSSIARRARVLLVVDSSNAKLRLAPAYLHVGDYARQLHFLR